MVYGKSGKMATSMELIFLPFLATPPQPRPAPYSTVWYAEATGLKRLGGSHNSETGVGIELTTRGWEPETTNTEPTCSHAYRFT